MQLYAPVLILSQSFITNDSYPNIANKKMGLYKDMAGASIPFVSYGNGAVRVPATT
jgi:hypothetical protein